MLPSVMAGISTSLEEVFAKNPTGKVMRSACPAGHILTSGSGGRALMAAWKCCVCRRAGHRAPGQSTRVGVKCQHCTMPNPVGGLRAEAVHTGTGRERTTDSWMLGFFHKTTRFLAFLPMHGIPDPELFPPRISCIPHLTPQTHRNLGFLSSGKGLTAILQKG